MSIQKPLRLRILIALTDLIKTVTPTNGYQFDLSDSDDGEKSVVRGRMILADSEPVNMVSLLEPPNAVEPIRSRAPDNTARGTDWDILIQGWARDDDDHEPCDLAYALAADVHKALNTAIVEGRATGRSGSNFLGMGAKVSEMKIGTPVIRPSEEVGVSGYGQFFTILTLKISEDIGNPFN